jgi:hypothetical protein
MAKNKEIKTNVKILCFLALMPKKGDASASPFFIGASFASHYQSSLIPAKIPVMDREQCAAS